MGYSGKMPIYGKIVVVHKHGVEGMEMESSDWSIVFQHLS